MPWNRKFCGVPALQDSVTDAETVSGIEPVVAVLHTDCAAPHLLELIVGFHHVEIFS